MADLVIDAGFIPVQNAQQEDQGGSGTQAWLQFANIGDNGKISDYQVRISYAIQNVVTNEDNSIEFDFAGISNVVIYFGKKQDSNIPIKYEMWLDTNNNGNMDKVFEQSTNMGTAINFGNRNYNATNKQHYKIKPEQYLQIPVRRMLHWLATAQRANDEFYYTIGGGKGIYNPNTATYRPMALRISNNFGTLNVDSGYINLRQNGAWRDKSRELLETREVEGAGMNRIRLNDKWWQQKIIGR